MSPSYHVQQSCQVTFIAKKQEGQWTNISVGISIADARKPLETDVPLIADLDIRTIDPLKLIEATKATRFQKEVWIAICQIAPGEVISYSDLAARIGRPKAYRAVANACGENRYAGVIPCHRIIGSNRIIGGYRWGPQAKAILLTYERSLRDNLEQA
jgi:O-6-methylguanine DNA methyltransferase